ncbi:MAG: hypothetical protein ACRDRY_01305 [Pseudonocardiaceae bacterium]
MAVMDYRTQDGLADYGFAIEFQPNGGWRVYIIFLPLHQDYDDGRQLPYQSIDRHGRRYVNWSSKLDSLGEAKTVAALWAELVQRYQRSQERTRASPAGPDRPGDAVTDTSSPGHSSRSPTPHPALEAV